MDYAHLRTEAFLYDLERRISALYTEAYNDLADKIKAYYASFEKRDKAMQAKVAAGLMSETDYKLWRLNQIGRGKRFEDLRDKIAERMDKANQVAATYINDMTPSIFSLNYNYEAYTIEKSYGNIGFTLWSEDTIRKMLVEQPTLLPLYPAKKVVDIPKDLLWNQQEITKQVTSGILQGESVYQIANRMQNITDMDRVAAVRNARTAVTNAQNSGRQQCYENASAIGITVRKRWVATKDNRTRHAHGVLDGQIVPYDAPFDYYGERLMFPGDTSLNASPSMIYNCRCTMRTVEKEGIEAEPRQMRVHNPAWDAATPKERREKGIPKNIVVNEMTYSEWKKWKESYAFTQGVSNGI